MAVRIIVDSTSDLPPEVAAQVSVVRLTVRFSDGEYVDGRDITKEEFYRKLETSTVLPTTSQATPFDFEEVFARAVQAGDSVVCITVSSGLSGTYQSAVIAAGEYPGQVQVVDSKNVTIGASLLVLYALELRDRGFGAEEIALNLLRMRDRVRLYAVVDTLEYLKKGGRISAAAAFAGELMNLKPIISLEDGKLSMAGKARGAKQAVRALMNMTERAGGIDGSKPVMLGYTGLNEQLLEQYLQESAGLWGENLPPRVMVGSVVGTHVGSGAMAVAFFAKP